MKNYSHTADIHAHISRTFITRDVCAIVKHFTRPLWDHDPWRRNTADVKCFENDIQHKTFSVAWAEAPIAFPGGAEPTLKGVAFLRKPYFPILYIDTCDMCRSCAASAFVGFLCPLFPPGVSAWKPLDCCVYIELFNFSLYWICLVRLLLLLVIWIVYRIFQCIQ